MKDLKAQVAKSHAGKMSRMLGGHTDEKADRALVKKMVKQDALTGKANGGRAKKTPHTSVNVLVAPRGDAAHAAPLPVSGGQAPGQMVTPPSRPVAPAVPAGPMPGGMPVAKRGGKISKRANGGGLHMLTGYDAGAGSGEGRLEKEAHEKRRRGK